MAGMGLSGGLSAGAGSDQLETVLRRKFIEAQAAQQAKFAMAKLAEEQRQADMGNAVQQRQLGQGDQRIGLEGRQLDQQGQQFGQRLDLDRGKLGEDVRQFDAAAPQRLANVRLSGAQAGEIERKPQAEQEGRDFITGRDKTQHGYQLGEIGAQGANQLRAIGARMEPPPPLDAAATKEQNEVADSLALIKEIRDDKALPTSTGPIQGRGFGALQDLEGFTRVKARHDNLVNKMQRAQAGKLKGQGQISNMEREMLKNAATALDMKLGDPDYLTELSKVEAQFQRMLTGPRAATPVKPGTPDYRKKYDY